MKPSTPTQAIDVGMGEEGRNRKLKEEQKKKHGAASQPSYLDHLVVSYDPHGSYSETHTHTHPLDQISALRQIGEKVREKIIEDMWVL